MTFSGFFSINRNYLNLYCIFCTDFHNIFYVNGGTTSQDYSCFLCKNIVLYQFDQQIISTIDDTNLNPELKVSEYLHSRGYFSVLGGNDLAFNNLRGQLTNTRPISILEFKNNSKWKEEADYYKNRIIYMTKLGEDLDFKSLSEEEINTSFGSSMTNCISGLRYTFNPFMDEQRSGKKYSTYAVDENFKSTEITRFCYPNKIKCL